MKMTHKELTAHIRNRIKVCGIKANCKMNVSCGHKLVTVSVPDFDARFTSEEIRQFVTIAKINRLTGVRGDPLDVELQAMLTEKMQWDFYLPVD